MIKRILLLIGAIMLFTLGVMLSPFAFVLTLHIAGAPSRYLRNVALSFDQTANALTGGDPDESVSSRMGKRVGAGDRGFSYVMCRLMHPFDKNHCTKAIESDEGGDKVLK